VEVGKWAAAEGALFRARLTEGEKQHGFMTTVACLVRQRACPSHHTHIPRDESMYVCTHGSAVAVASTRVFRMRFFLRTTPFLLFPAKTSMPVTPRTER